MAAVVEKAEIQTVIPTMRLVVLVVQAAAEKVAEANKQQRPPQYQEQPTQVAEVAVEAHLAL